MFHHTALPQLTKHKMTVMYSSLAFGLCMLVTMFISFIPHFDKSTPLLNLLSFQLQLNSLLILFGFLCVSVKVDITSTLIFSSIALLVLDGFFIGLSWLANWQFNDVGYWVVVYIFLDVLKVCLGLWGIGIMSAFFGKLTKSSRGTLLMLCVLFSSISHQYVVTHNVWQWGLLSTYAGIASIMSIQSTLKKEGV